MKKILLILLIIFAVVPFVGCSDDNIGNTQSTGSTVATTKQITSTVDQGTVASHTASPAAYIYDGTGDKQGKKIATVLWNEHEKIETINNLIHSNGVISSDKKAKKDVSKADNIFVVELINKGMDNNLFNVYLIGDKVYAYGEEFTNATNAFINGYADITPKEFKALLK